MKKIFLLFFFFVMAQADIIHFYHKSLRTLQYNKNYSLYTQANSLKEKSVTSSRYANFSLDAVYTNTHTDTLPNAFSTTDVALSDTFDLFAKQSYKIEALAYDLKAKKTMIKIKKEQLFISLVNMIAYYQESQEKLRLEESFFTIEQKSYTSLQKLLANGSIKAIDVLRFKNTLTTLQTKIISEKNNIKKMREQLKLYAPHEHIPHLGKVMLHASQKAFLKLNPYKTLNHIEAQKLRTQAQGFEKSYLPEVSVGMAYQQLGDPTGYGDNYAFSATVHMPINMGDFKQSEALKVQALSKQINTIEYDIQRKKEFMTHRYAYLNASKQLNALHSALKDYERSQTSTKKAFMQGYVDFNTYLQVMTKTLHLKEHIITLSYQKRKEATILNDISSGIIYE